VPTPPTGATADRKVLAQPSAISISKGRVSPLGIVEPGRMLAFAASSAGSVTLRRTGETADGAAIADAVTSLDGTTRTFQLPVDWGGAAAGDDFLAWSDQLHLWILLAGSDEPVQLAQVADEMGNLRYRATGTWLYWHADAQDGASAVDSLLSVSCP
jgi:hypothetical protein